MTRHILGWWGGRRGDALTPSTDYPDVTGPQGRRLHKRRLAKRRRQIAKAFIKDISREGF